MTEFVNNFLIVDDDNSISLELVKIVNEIGCEVSAVAKSSSEALRCIEKVNPELILLDYNIKGNLGGQELALAIKHLKIPILFLLKTNKRYDLDNLSSVPHFGFIEKPITAHQLKISIETLLLKSGIDFNNIDHFSSDTSMLFKKGGRFHRVSIKDILFIKAADDYTITITPDQEFVSSLRLFMMESKLEKFGFFKSHRSYLVNPNNVESMNHKKTHLVVKTHKVPISRNNKSMIKEIYKKIMTERVAIK